MKILMVTELLPESRSSGISGGIEARTQYLREILERRHELEIIAERSDGSRWSPASALSIPRRLLFAGRALAQGLRTDFDVVEGSNFVVYPVAWLLARLKRRPLVLLYADVLIGRWRSGDFGRAGAVGEAMERWVLRRRVDRYIAISHATARRLVDNGVDGRRVTVVPCGYDPELTEQAVALPVEPSQRLVVVGRLVSYKRVDLVVQALGLLAPRWPELELHIIGQGPEREALGALVMRLGLEDRVRFLGYVPSHLEVLRHVAGSRVFVSASEIEGFGIVLVEAMALGVPYVVADNEAYTETSGGGVGGALFGSGDVKQLVAQVEAMLGDAARHAEAGRVGRERAVRYAWDGIAQATERVYEEVVDTRRRRPKERRSSPKDEPCKSFSSPSSRPTTRSRH